MNKEDMLRQIAEKGYDVGFGAKKHFATYDIICKAPNLICFISLAVGVLALFIEPLASKHMSGILIILGISGLFVNSYDSKKRAYEEAGKKLTILFNKLKTLYFSVKAKNETDFNEDETRLNEIINEYYETSMSSQIVFSDWYAHYKYFWQHQIGWVDDQLKFKLWRDKIPLSFMVFVSLSLICLALLIVRIHYEQHILPF